MKAYKVVEVEAELYDGSERSASRIRALALDCAGLRRFGDIQILVINIEGESVVCPVGHYVVRGAQGKLHVMSPLVFNSIYKEKPSEIPGDSNKGFGFPEAIRKLRAGSRVTRKGWNGDYLEPPGHSMATYLDIYTVKVDGFGKYAPTFQDIEANDWRSV